MGLKWRNLEFVYVDPFICFKDDVSSGPSSNDTSWSNPLSTLLAGPQSGSGGGSSISQGYASQAESNPVATNIFSSTTPFSADTTAVSGAGTSQSGGDPFASISNPGGGAPIGTTGAFGTGATPFDTFGGVGAATSTGLPGASGGGPVAPSAPSGVSPIAGPDPTTAISSSGTGQPAAAASAPAQSGSFLDNLFSSIGKSATNNPLSFLGGAGMLYNAYSQYQAGKNIPSISQIAPQLEQQASQLNAQGQQLAQYLTSGNLPPGLQASLDQATKAAKQNIISNFASRGLSTDPSKNSALAQELAQVDAQAVISTAQMGQQLMQTGIQETGLSSQLYSTLANIDQSMQAQIQKSIAGFAAAMSPSKSITLNTAA